MGGQSSYYKYKQTAPPPYVPVAVADNVQIHYLSKYQSEVQENAIPFREKQIINSKYKRKEMKKKLHDVKAKHSRAIVNQGDPNSAPTVVNLNSKVKYGKERYIVVAPDGLRDAKEVIPVSKKNNRIWYVKKEEKKRYMKNFFDDDSTDSEEEKEKEMKRKREEDLEEEIYRMCGYDRDGNALDGSMEDPSVIPILQTVEVENSGHQSSRNSIRSLSEQRSSSHSLKQEDGKSTGRGSSFTDPLTELDPQLETPIGESPLPTEIASNSTKIPDSIDMPTTETPQDLNDNLVVNVGNNDSSVVPAPEVESGPQEAQEAPEIQATQEQEAQEAPEIQATQEQEAQEAPEIQATQEVLEVPPPATIPEEQPEIKETPLEDDQMVEAEPLNEEVQQESIESESVAPSNEPDYQLPFPGEEANEDKEDDSRNNKVEDEAAKEKRIKEMVKKGRIELNKKFNFKTGSSELSQSEENVALLDEVASIVLKYNIKISVEGHTNRGFKPIDYYKKLSLDRAKAICNALKERGIPEDQLVPIGWGYSKFSPDLDPKRVEIHIQKG